MIRVISGAVNSGKTSLLLKETAALSCCGGFLSPKVFRENQCIGYDLHFLRSGEQLPFIRKSSCCDPGEDLEEQLGDFGFYRSGFEAARRELKALSREDPAIPVFIDELGPVELYGGGYIQEVQNILPFFQELTLCIRTKIRFEMIKELNISKYILIYIRENSILQEPEYV